MDDRTWGGTESNRWSQDGFGKRRKTEEKDRQSTEPGCSTRTAAEIDLSHEVRSHLGRRSAHPSDWLLITAKSAHYNLRTSDRVQLFEKTRKSWVPLKALNGTRSGQEALAFRRRSLGQRFKCLGDAGRGLADQLAYDAMVQQVFFQKDLNAYFESHGYPFREQMLQ